MTNRLFGSICCTGALLAGATTSWAQTPNPPAPSATAVVPAAPPAPAPSVAPVVPSGMPAAPGVASAAPGVAPSPSTAAPPASTTAPLPVGEPPAADAPPTAGTAEAGVTPAPEQPVTEAEAEAAVATIQAEQAATADEEAAALAAEEEEALAALMGGDDEPEIDEYNLSFYGFADFSMSKVLFESFDGYPSTFALGRLNLYFGGELGDNWRTLSEVRFSYLPHGTSTGGDFFAPAPPTNTTVPDYVDYDRPRRWGSTMIERAWIEKTFEPWLSVRVGHWLTPYGIWNVDHGSPVILGVTRPYAVGEALFPESQAGIQVHGTTNFSALNLGYKLTVSNGRGPFDTHKDLDANKAIGWRVFGNYDSDIGIFSLGYSGYKGDYTEATATTTFTDDGGFVSELVTDRHYKELGTAFDASWKLGGASLQSELIIQDIDQDHYPTRYQPALFGPAGYVPDYRRLGVYTIAAYRFDSLLGLTPWLGYEYYESGAGAASFFPDGVNELYAGLNLRPSPRAVFKFQYIGVFFKGADRSDIANFQVAWSF